MSGPAPRGSLLDHGLALDTYLQELLGDLRQPCGRPAGDSGAKPSAPAPQRRAGVLRARLLEVAGLSLAVPLERVNRVVTDAVPLTALSEADPLLLGVLSYPGGEAWVVDTASLILARAGGPRRAADAAQFVVLDEGRLALAGSRVGSVVELQDSDVKWRTAAGRRPWLAGTVLKHMCALVDIEALRGLLADTVAR